MRYVLLRYACFASSSVLRSYIYSQPLTSGAVAASRRMDHGPHRSRRLQRRILTMRRTTYLSFAPPSGYRLAIWSGYGRRFIASRQTRGGGTLSSTAETGFARTADPPSKCSSAVSVTPLQSRRPTQLYDPARRARHDFSASVVFRFGNRGRAER